jgi:hypothetical protein
MEAPPADIHGELMDLQVNPPGIGPDPSSEVATGSAASPGAAIDADDVAIREEGVYAPRRPRRVVFSEIVEFRTTTLARRRPHITRRRSRLHRGPAPPGCRATLPLQEPGSRSA